MTPRRRSINIDEQRVPYGSDTDGIGVDNVIYSSGIMGTDPATAEVPDDGAAQVHWAFENLRKFLDAAGATPEDVVRVTLLLQDPSLRDAINVEWEKMFPDPESRPARHAMNLQLNRNMLVQLEIVAVVAD